MGFLNGFKGSPPFPQRPGLPILVHFLTMFSMGLQIEFGQTFWSILGSTWLPKSTQSLPRSNKNRSRKRSNFQLFFLIILDRYWIDFGAILASKLAGRGTQKYFFKFFIHFAIWANLPTSGHMIDFFANLAFNLMPKPSKIRPKMPPRSIKNRFQHRSRF